MTSFRLSQVRFRVGGWFASACQKLLIQSVLRVCLMSSNTARTSGLAASRRSAEPWALLSPDLAARDLAGQPAGQEQRQHANVAPQRPQRMAEGRRTVPLEDDMAEPSRRVAEDRRRQQPAPVPGRPRPPPARRSPRACRRSATHVTAGRRAAPGIAARIRDKSSPTGVNGEKVPRCQVDARTCDLDHTIPYDQNGPPGQTRAGNLACLCRRHHRAKTTGRWRYLRTPDGDYLWHGPYGTTYLVTPRGTSRLPAARTAA